MRQIVSFLILTALFLLLVGSRFEPSDGDRLKAMGRLALLKVQGAMPPAEKVAGPVNAIRDNLPLRLEDRVRSRLQGDKRLAGVDFTVTVDGDTVRLRGIVADETARARALNLAGSTTGVEQVVDDLAVPE